MIWTTWRQHRAEVGVGALILSTLVAGMIAVGTVARNRARGLGLPTCLHAHGSCGGALEALHRDFHSIPPFTFALIALPLLAGMFWTAPMVSREYEAGTHRLAWTQSVSPRRWIAIKIASIFGVTGLAALGLGLLAGWTLDPLTPAFGGRYNSTWYAVQGIVPVAYMLFALAVGVASSAVIRRTIPAMAITLVVFAAAVIPVHWMRIHFAPLTSRTYTVALTALLDRPEAAPREMFPPTASSSDWIARTAITDPAGRPVIADGLNVEVLGSYCPDLLSGPPAGAQQGGGGGQGTPGGNPGRVNVPPPPPPSPQQLAACRPAVQHLSIRERIAYQPAAHFWLIQSVESALFLVVAGLFAGAAVYGVTRRRPA